MCKEKLVKETMEAFRWQSLTCSLFTRLCFIQLPLIYIDERYLTEQRFTTSNMYGKGSVIYIDKPQIRNSFIWRDIYTLSK